MHTEDLFDLDIRVTTPNRNAQTDLSDRQAPVFHLMPTMTTTGGGTSRTPDDQGIGG